MNLYSNFVYRHLLLGLRCDTVFSELILYKDLDTAIKNNKLDLIEGDAQKTVFQVGVASPSELDESISFITKKVTDIPEININMGCPQSSLVQNAICGGLLWHPEKIRLLSKKLSSYGAFVPSIKIRLGTSLDNIAVTKYLDAAYDGGVRKVYVHARPLGYNYNKPALHEYVCDLRPRYSDMDIVLNGDIDSPQVATRLGGDVMIGRGALTNPFIFEDIKNSTLYRAGPYNPLVKDPYVVRKDSIFLSAKKVDIIRKFLILCEKYSLRPNLVKANLFQLIKGVTASNTLVKQINQATTSKDMLSLFDIWVSHTQKHL